MATKKSVSKSKRTTKKKAAKKAPKKSGSPRRRATPGDTAAITRKPKAKRPSPDQKMLPAMADSRNEKLDVEISIWQKGTIARNNAGSRIKKSLGKIASLLKADKLSQYSLNGDKFVLVPGEDVVKHMTVKDQK